MLVKTTLKNDVRDFAGNYPAEKMVRPAEGLRRPVKRGGLCY